MAELTFQTLYDDAVQTFGGQQPGRQLEAALLEQFQARPAALVAAIGKAGELYSNGKAHSPWGIVKSELARHEQRAHHIADTNHGDLAKQTALAHRYIQLAAHHLPTETELLIELFGPAGERGTAPGHLNPWAGNQQLEQQMIGAWHAAKENEPA